MSSHAPKKGSKAFLSLIWQSSNRIANRIGVEFFMWRPGRGGLELLGDVDFCYRIFVMVLLDNHHHWTMNIYWGSRTIIIIEQLFRSRNRIKVTDWWSWSSINDDDCIEASESLFNDDCFEASRNRHLQWRWLFSSFKEETVIVQWLLLQQWWLS